MSWQTYKVVTSLITLPGMLLISIAISLVMFKAWRYMSKLILLGSLFSMYYFSTEQGVLEIAKVLHYYEPLGVEQLEAPVPNSAIVVLGGGKMAGPEYEGETVNAATLMRVRYAAKIRKSLNVPVILSGGTPVTDTLSEAALMSGIFVADYGITDNLLLEQKSRTTYENAKYTQELLKKHNIEVIYLVTDAAHMQRAVWSFHKQEIKAIPAPTDFFMRPQSLPGMYRWLPSAYHMARVNRILHEVFGLVWYHVGTQL